MRFGTWLLAMAEPVLARILLSLGFSVVSIVGVEAAVGQLKTAFVTQVNSLPADMLNVFLFAGGGVGLGMVLGALATRLLLWSIQNATKILGAAPGS
jgi:hypothetical protein